MLYSIVTADQNEVLEGDLDDFLRSVAEQEVRVVLVLRDVPLDVLESYAAHPAVFKVLQSKRAGLSEVRNLALDYLSSADLSEVDIVSFPDDDCRYPLDLVQKVNERVVIDGLDLLVGRYGELPLEITHSRSLTYSDALFRSSSVCLFVRWGTLLQAGRFNEGMGVGSGNFDFGEDNDFAIRALWNSSRAAFDSSVYVWHKEIRPTTGRRSKGYLVSILINARVVHLWPLFVRGVAGTCLRSIVRPSRARQELHELRSVLAPHQINRAFAEARRSKKWAGSKSHGM